MKLDESSAIIGHYDLVRYNNSKLHLYNEESDVYRNIALEALRSMRETDALLEVSSICAQIHKRQLEVHGAVKEVQEPAPFIENGCLILLLGKLIIDVLKLDRFGVIVCSRPADAILEHALKRDRLLGCAGNSVILPCPLHNRLDLLTIFFAESLWKIQRDVFFWFFLLHGEQSHLPPFPPHTDGAVSCNSYQSHMVFPSACGILPQ